MDPEEPVAGGSLPEGAGRSDRLINRDRKRAAKDVSDLLKNLDTPLVEQLMTKLNFEMVRDDFTGNLFWVAAAQLKQPHLPAIRSRRDVLR